MIAIPMHVLYIYTLHNLTKQNALRLLSFTPRIFMFVLLEYNTLRLQVLKNERMKNFLRQNFPCILQGSFICILQMANGKCILKRKILLMSLDSQ